MKRKSFFFVILSFCALLTMSVVSFFLISGNLTVYRFTGVHANSCVHEGYHYDSAVATSSKTGHIEHWTCCKCHSMFETKPAVGTFKDAGSPDIPKESAYYNEEATYYYTALNKQGGSSGTSQLTTCRFDKAMPSITLPTKTGYDFAGYYTDTNGTGTKYYNADGSSANDFNLGQNDTLYAYWTIHNYTVTFARNVDAYGTLSTYSESIPYGTTYTASANVLSFSNGVTVTATPTTATARYSYAFTSWSSTSGTVSSDFTITATFTRSVNNYTVSIASDHSAYGTVDVTEVTVPYGTAFSTSGNVLTIGDYTITATTNEATAQYTYSFTGWNVTSGTITGNRSILASFTRTENNYTVTFTRTGDSANYGTMSQDSIVVPYGTTYSVVNNVMTFTKSGNTVGTVTATPNAATAQYTYSFSSWSSTKGTITGAKSINVVFTRTLNEYTVTLDRNNTGFGELSQYSVTGVPYGTSYSVSGNELTIGSTTIIATPTATSAQYTYAFKSWKIGGTTLSTGTITGATTITANFSRSVRNYVVTIARNNTTYGTVSPTKVSSVPYGTSYSVSDNVLTINKTTPVSVTATPAATTDQYTYTFASWKIGSSVISTGTITGATTITANFSRTTRSYTITFMNGSTTHDTQTVQYGNKVTAPSNPTATNGTFVGWFSDENCQTQVDLSTYTVTGTATLYAGFTYSLSPTYLYDNATRKSPENPDYYALLNEGLDIYGQSNAGGDTSNFIYYTGSKSPKVTYQSRYLAVSVRDFVRNENEVYACLKVYVNNEGLNPIGHNYPESYIYSDSALTFYYDLASYIGTSPMIQIRNVSGHNMVITGVTYSATSGYSAKASSGYRTSYDWTSSSTTGLSEWTSTVSGRNPVGEGYDLGKNGGSTTVCGILVQNRMITENDTKLVIAVRAYYRSGETYGALHVTLDTAGYIDDNVPIYQLPFDETTSTINSDSYTTITVDLRRYIDRKLPIKLYVTPSSTTHLVIGTITFSKYS